MREQSTIEKLLGVPPGFAFPWVSLIPLVLANQIPLWGVLFKGWTVFSVTLLFALENVVIGLFSVLRMALVKEDQKKPQVIFFIIHYGMFTAGHIFFVTILFGMDVLPEIPESDMPWDYAIALTTMLRDLLNPLSAGELKLWLPVLGLLVSHGISFGTNYVAKREYQRTTLGQQVFRPYGRVVVLHVFVILAGLIVELTGSHAASLVLLVWLKIALDIRAHCREQASKNDAYKPHRISVLCGKCIRFGDVVFELPRTDDPAEQARIMAETKATCPKCGHVHTAEDKIAEYPSSAEADASLERRA